MKRSHANKEKENFWNNFIADSQNSWSMEISGVPHARMEDSNQN